MTGVKKLTLVLTFLAAGAPIFAAEGPGVARKAGPLFRVGPLPVTNSMVTSWLVAIGLILLVRLAIGKPKLVPGRGQAVVESLIEGIRDIVAPIVGDKALGAAFPLLLTLFAYILIQNWSGLVPGVGTISMLKNGEWMELIRPAHADMNGTFALALVSFLAWLYIVLRYAGLKFILMDLFGNKADKRDVPAVIYYLLFPIFFAVGLLEIVSIMFRPVSLSFRLYGNIFGGENLIHSMSAISRWGLPVPFYFMEMLVGLVQAFVFTLLIAVYIGLLCNHSDDHGHSEAASAEH
jgi:F-type H+-transporting ATPase subunit a